MNEFAIRFQSLIRFNDGEMYRQEIESKVQTKICVMGTLHYIHDDNSESIAMFTETLSKYVCLCDIVG